MVEHPQRDQRLAQEIAAGHAQWLYRGEQIEPLHDAGDGVSHDLAGQVHWDGMFMRSDIGYRAVRAKLEETSS